MGSRFRTIEVSEPLLEFHGLRWMTVKSGALKGRGDITLFVPQNCQSQKNLPIVILLHGVYGSHWAWAMKGSAHLTAAEMIAAKEIPPVILAMPSDGLWGDGSAYLAHSHADFETWIMDDVVEAIRETIPQAGAQSRVFISGLSMGGYGALRLGGKYASRLHGISAHSSITHFAQMAQFAEEPISHYPSVPESEKPALFWLLKNRGSLPPLRFDCGTEDDLIEPNRALHRQLLEHGMRHEYAEFPGGHSWNYWRQHLRDTLRFFNY